jgi:drug/metabolite transporter (DMT)-like permease
MKQSVLTALLLLVTAVWGWTFTVVKDAVAVYGVAAFLTVRFAVASAALGTFSLRRIDRRSLRTGGAIGGVLAAGYLLQTFGLDNTTATNCGLITGLFVLVGPLANRLLFGMRVRRVLWLAIAVSLAGLVLLTGTGLTPFGIGDALTVGAAGCFGLHIALLDRFAKGHDALGLALAQTCVATLVFAVAWPLTQPLAWPTPEVWWALLITGVLATAAAYSIQTYVQQRLSAVRTAVILTTEPLFAALFGYLLAGDRLTVVQLLGGALMLGAVAAAEIMPATGRSRIAGRSA